MIQDLSTIELCMVESLDDMPSEPGDGDSEAVLIERAKTDLEAFGALFELYYQKILNYTYRCTLNLAVAEELTSNTFFKALRSLSKYRHRLRFYAWLYGIATNEVRMHWRSEARKRKTSLVRINLQELDCNYFISTAIENEESIQEKMQIYAHLHEHLLLLPEHYRSVLALRFFEDLPYDAIAEVLGKRIGTVKSLIHRAVKRLKVFLEQDATFDISRHLD